MSKRIAKFSKVSYDQFKKDVIDSDFFKFGVIEESYIENMYNNIKLPKRGTSGSAGYDFFTPIEIYLKPGETAKIPTGIRCKMEDGWVLKLYPRSGLGFKYRLQLNNSVGIIDEDYFNAKNEGHIMAKITNDTNEELTVSIDVGGGFMQGIFVEYGITVDDEAYEVRTGGFGSTDKK